MARIALRGVEKRFGDFVALMRCDLEVTDQEFIVLVGPSGSGKTTLLRLIAGLEHASGGNIYFDETCVNDLDVGDRDIAMVFQNYGLYPHMSVYGNLAFGLRRRKLPKDEIDARVRRTAGLLNIDPLLDRRPRQLSGGQRQRVALGRAIVRDPAVFLLDEPLSNLDAQLRVQMRAEILKVHRTVAATAVYVTHDQVEAMTMGDRIVVMHEGRIQQVGTPEEVHDAPVNRFVASFIGTPAMGFLTCRITRRNGAVELENAAARVCLAAEQAKRLAGLNGNTVDVGIRPEHLDLAGKEPAGADVVLSSSIEVVEMLGAEQYVHFDAAGERLTARLPRNCRVRTDDRAIFTASAEHLHFFDPQSGLALR